MAERGKQIITPRSMNLDLAKELLSSDQATFLKNCVVNYNITNNAGTTGQSHNLGLITPVLSNINNAVHVGDLPSGINLCIGSEYDEKTNSVYFAVYNSTGEHTIWVYEANTNVYTLILQEPLFNFSPSFLITSMDIVIADTNTPNQNQELINILWYWTDGNNWQRKINVTKAIAGGYNVIDFEPTPTQFMDRIKYQPYYRPVITNTLTNPDTNFKENFVVNNQFQFKYDYTYDDGETSTTGFDSTLAYSTNKDLNFIEVQMNAGSSLVTYVGCYFRYGNIGAWKKYDSISRDSIINDPIYNYDALTNLFIYQFYNNRQFEIVDQTDIEKPFDFMFQKCFAEHFVESNVLIDANGLEGYDNLTLDEQATPSVEITYTNFEPLKLTLAFQLNFSFSAGGQFKIDVVHQSASSGVENIEDTFTVVNGDPSPHTYSSILTDVDAGDLVFLRVSQGNAAATLGARTLTGTYSNIVNPVNCGTGDFSVSNAGSSGVVLGAVVTFNTINTDPCSTWSTSTNKDEVPNSRGGWAQLKQGGQYQFGFIMYDAAGRSSYVQASPEQILTIQNIQLNAQFQLQAIDWHWNGLVFPDWVYAISVCRTKNLNIDRTLGMGYLQFCIVFDPLTGFLKYDGTAGTPGVDNIVKIQFTLQNVIDYNTANFENTTTTYTYTQGDIIQFIRNGDAAWYGFASSVVEEVLSNSPTSPNVTLICSYNDSLSNLVNGAWVEIYTPAKVPQNATFYEISDRILTTGVAGNNQSSEAVTTLHTFDTFPIFYAPPYVSTLVNDFGAIPFEHHSIYSEGVVPSNGEDIGRINVINVNARQLWYPARLRRSNVYLPQSFVNGLSTFDDVEDVDKKDYNRGDGGIVQLQSEGYNLAVLQTDSIFRVMMAKQLVTLADGTNQLVAANKFFSDPIQMKGDTSGCQNSESFIYIDGMMYWCDVKRKMLAQCDWEKVTDVSRTAMAKSYFEAKCSYIFNYNQNGDENDFFILPAGYDPKHKVYYLTFFNVFIPTGEGIPLTTTGQPVDRMQWGLGAENLNFVSTTNNSQYDIFSPALVANISPFKFEFLQDWSTVANKFGVRYAGDRPNQPPPTARGGYNTTITCASGAGGTNTYTVSFWSNEVLWCQSVGIGGMILNCNLNDYDIAAYQDNISYTASQLNFLGINSCQEYETPNSCSCALCTDGAAVASAANTLIAGLGSLLNGKVITRDWKGIPSPTSSLTDAFSDEMENINSTSTRIYLSEEQLMTHAQYAAGQTAATYFENINIAVDTIMANRIADLTAIINQPVAITQLFSISTSGFAGTYLQYYFYARMLLKVITIEANNPNSIELSMCPRVDTLNAKAILNNLGNTLSLFTNFYSAGNTIYYPTLPSGMYGAASVDGSNHGYMIVINPTANNLDDMNVLVNSISRPFISVTTVRADSLDGVVTFETRSDIPIYSINVVEF